MADICITYSSTNRELVEKLYELLSSQWDVWWDDQIVGKYPDAIEREIPQAKCLLPIWSTSSRDSDMVLDELDLAKRHHIKIVSAKIEACEAPIGYRRYSCVDLRGWSGETDHAGYKQLLRRLTSVIKPRAKPIRPETLASGKVRLPALFLSASSFETRLGPLEAIKTLRLFGSPSILISAYDTLPNHRPGLVKELRSFRARGGFVLIDSGNYEASRRGDKDWKSHKLESALKGMPHDWVFCFDVMNPSSGERTAVNQIIAAVERDQKFTRNPVLPIVHARSLKDGGYDLEPVPRVIRQVAERLEPPLVAIPERELGPDLIARARMVRRIRNELDKLPFYQPLHLLGTGNPWSIAVLTASGADSFDGLEWCRVLIDRENGTFNHFQNYDFFAYQAGWADSPIAKVLLRDGEVEVALKAAIHNLDYYAELSQRLRKASARGDFEALLTELLGKQNVETLRKSIPELVQ
jgi:hypothetical protein